MGYKRFKDPIYGYIEIEESIMQEIIDTACFQRLRYVRQTSYAPLYSAALHNRFIHSIGVFHLGKIAFGAIKKASIENYPEAAKNIGWDAIQKNFLLACLLHDVGHAPFSHSGEQFYLNDGIAGEEKIYLDLKSFVNDTEFSADVDFYNNKKAAAPHEVMSAVVALVQFPDKFGDTASRDFFARCIIGYPYKKGLNFEKCLRNILISLLNSSIIDVDKLDYLIRDAYVTGYNSISIDYERLLNAITIKYDEDTFKYSLAFHKSALSVLEDVIYAHDSERKWIQNHPVVLYEHFLVQQSIKACNKYFRKSSSDKLFCLEALLDSGKDFGEKGTISLLCDDDIIYLIKNKCSNELTTELFSRNKRRHPVWKSEAEYKAIFERQLGEEKLNLLEKQFKQLESFLLQEIHLPIVNSNAVDACQKIIDSINASKTVGDVDKETQLKRYNYIYGWLTFLTDYAVSHNIEPNFVLIRANHFRSGFQKNELESLLIDFPNLHKEVELKNVVNLLKGQDARANFFYIYYVRSDESRIDINDFTDAILQKALKIR